MKIIEAYEEALQKAGGAFMDDLAAFIAGAMYSSHRAESLAEAIEKFIAQNEIYLRPNLEARILKEVLK